MKLFESCLVLALPLSMAWACGSSGGDVDVTTNGGSASDGSHAVGGASFDLGGEGQDLAPGAAGRDDGTGDGGRAAAGGSSVGGSSATGSSACSNGIDDDGDGLIDGFDPECTGLADDDEGSFATGI
ncbi:MAG TPA: hypothetical protein VEQ58_03080, partial [Polyangiaceae bacterium]|nr:hypothetical protein [Polyangiaceae bacterium]